MSLMKSVNRMLKDEIAKVRMWLYKMLLMLLFGECMNENALSFVVGIVNLLEIGMWSFVFLFGQCYSITKNIVCLS